MKEIHIFGGGTVFHVRPHFALTAPAYGTTARTINYLLLSKGVPKNKIDLHLTKMAGGLHLETNEDVGKAIDKLILTPEPKIIFMNTALCDFEGHIIKGNMALVNKFVDEDNEMEEDQTKSGKDQPRLKTSGGNKLLRISPAEKIINKIRKHRKDIFLVGFKTTAGATEEEQFNLGMSLLKSNSCNIVLANDTQTRINKILTPEMASYANTQDRFSALDELVDMVLARSTNEFTKTDIMSVAPIAWENAPGSLRKIVEHCVKNGAYKPFSDVTVGHFGFLESSDTLLSSRRKQNYNLPKCLDLVRVIFLENGTIQSYGGKPSAGVRSQYEVLKSFPQFDCVVHFHCPMKSNNIIPVRPQKYFECGSHQCGRNTATGIELFFNDKIGAVMLDKHGPNILFHSTIDPQGVINFIDTHFDLSRRTS